MWDSDGYDPKDASEAELTKLKESTNIPTSTQGDDPANAHMDSVIDFEYAVSCRELRSLKISWFL